MAEDRGSVFSWQLCRLLEAVSADENKIVLKLYIIESLKFEGQLCVEFIKE